MNGEDGVNNSIIFTVYSTPSYLISFIETPGYFDLSNLK